MKHFADLGCILMNFELFLPRVEVKEKCPIVICSYYVQHWVHTDTMNFCYIFRPTEETDQTLNTSELYLCDSGAQYKYAVHFHLHLDH